MHGNTQLRGNLALDTGVLVEYLTASSQGAVVNEYVANMKTDERIHCSLHTISELFYVLCRSKGSKFASDKLKELLESRAVVVHSTLELALRTGELKCQRAISLADCAVLATAELARCSAVFMKEKELEQEISKKRFEVEVLFLD